MGLPTRLPVRAIKRCELLFQPRGEVPAHLADLARVLKRGDFFDPLMVLQIGRDPILVDGHHRHTVYSRAGRTAPVPVSYFDGDVRAAMIAAGEANHKAKLPMSNAQRQDRAWRLIVMGVFTKAEVQRGAGISYGQVGIMRAVAKSLGAEAHQYEKWWSAHEAAKGNSLPPMTDAERDEWLEAQAADYATRLHKAFGSQLTGNIELAARALELHFGDRIGDLRDTLPIPESRSDDDLDF